MGRLSTVPAEEYFSRFIYTTILLIPLLILTDTGLSLVHLPDFAFRPFVQLSLTTIIAYYGSIFFVEAAEEVRTQTYGGMLLTSVALVLGYLYAFLSVILPYLPSGADLEIAVLFWILLFGHYFIKRVWEAGIAREDRMDGILHTVHVFTHDKLVERSVYKLASGDIVLIKKGDTIPGTARIQSGEGSVSIGGGKESSAVRKPGDFVHAGEICVAGRLEIVMESDGALPHDFERERSSETHPSSAGLRYLAERGRLAVFISTLIVTAGSLYVWAVVAGAPLYQSVFVAISILIVSAPHILRLAVSLAESSAQAAAKKRSFKIERFETVEKIASVTTVLFDEADMLPHGAYTVQKIVLLPSQSKSIVSKNGEEDILATAASIEHHSNHPIGHAIVARAKEQSISYTPADSFSEKSGKGVQGIVGSQAFGLGSRSFMKEERLWNEDAEQLYRQTVREGKKAVFIADTVVFGALVLSDTRGSVAQSAVKRLHALGIRTGLFSTHSQEEARVLADSLSIDALYSDMTPDKKQEVIKKIQEDDGGTVMLVGGGDMPNQASTEADISMTIGTGQHEDESASAFALVGDKPEDVVDLIEFSKKHYNWAFVSLSAALVYNIVAIPIAAGALAPWSVVLRPGVAALVMVVAAVGTMIGPILLQRQH